MSENRLVVREHDTLIRSEITAAGQGKEANLSMLAAQPFDALQSLLLGNLNQSGEYEGNPVAIPTKHRGRDALKLTQWVGLLRAPDGTTVEILPKTHERPGSRTDNPDESLLRSRALLMKMLAATDERFRVAPPADLDAAQMPLFELLLRSILESIKVAVRRGVPHTYISQQEERPNFKGRLDMPRQIRQPPHRRHLFQVQYDEFLPFRPEARLIRLTVERVLRLTHIQGTKRLGRELLVALQDVPPSQDIRRDFAQWRLQRGQAHFAPLEGLARLVLYELNPLVGGMTARAQAVLFDMNKVYEAYVAHQLRLQYPHWNILSQVTEKSLGEVNEKSVFPVRPDLLIVTETGETIVADTKWKRLVPDKSPTYSIINSDVYQMLAYHQVFQCLEKQQKEAQLWLIYPHLLLLENNRQVILLPLQQQLKIVTLDLESDLLGF